MAKFTKSFLGVPDGEIYPVQYEEGDEIPEELLEAAKEAGAADGKNGGGEGKKNSGRHPVTPWGKPTKGAKTRRKKSSDKLIISRRKGK